MIKMNEQVKELLTKQRTIVLATAAPNGIPNVVPIHSKHIIDDETIMITNQFMNKTLKNMQKNPQVAITFWEGIRGYQIKGNCVIENSGELYEKAVNGVAAYAKSKNVSLKCNGIILIKVTEVYDVSPGPNAGKQIT